MEPEARSDNLEEALGQALRLIESAVTDHRRSVLASATAELPVDGEAVAGWVARLVLRAERDVIWSLPEITCEDHARLVAQTLAQLSGKRVRIADAVPAAGDPRARVAAHGRHGAAAGGAGVRLGAAGIGRGGRRGGDRARALRRATPAAPAPR